MPRATEPGLRYEIWLDFDENKPEETRPAFICKALSMRDQANIVSVQSEVHKTTSTDEMNQKVLEGLGLCITGWKNMVDQNGQPMEFSVESLASVLNFAEAYELMRKAVRACQVSEEDKKKSD